MGESSRVRGRSSGWMQLLVAAMLLLPSFCCGVASVTASITVNTAAGGMTDVSTITVAFNGFKETVHYGQYSTAASVASTFGAMFSRDFLKDKLCAWATGNLITFKLKNGQAFTPVVITGSTASYSLVPSGFPATTGTVADEGTVTLWVTGPNGQVAVASTMYGEGSTPMSVAAELAQAVVPNSPVKVTAVNDNIYIVATQPGLASNYAYTLTTASNNSQVFTTPSFASASGTLSGGSDTSSGSATTPIYSYIIPAPGASTGYDPNSNLSSYWDSVMGTWSFNYDFLNRLASGISSQGLNANSCWGYDSFGNRTSQVLSTDTITRSSDGMSCTPQATATATWSGGNTRYNALNRIDHSENPATQLSLGSPVNYDIVNSTNAGPGNVIADGLNGGTPHRYLYDADGRICAVSSPWIGNTEVYTGYLYNAEGQRVAKGSLTSFSCDMKTNSKGEFNNGFSPTNESILGQGGEQLAELALDEDGTMAWQHTNVYAAGALFAVYDPIGLHFMFTDWLGTRRAQTDYAGVLEQTCQSLPFGDGMTCTPTPTSHLFTGYQRDDESGNDYAQARYYGSSTGRFLSPDPSGLQYADIENPQSFNQYSYVMNNPLEFTDPSGRHFECTSSSLTYTDSDGHTHTDPGLPQCKVVEDDIDLRDFQPMPTMGSLISGSDGTAARAAKPAPNNGRNCSAGPASAGQYGAATAEVATLTSQYASGLGPGNRTFGPGTATSQVMGQSAGVQDVLNQYYMLGRTSGLYGFGAVGYAQAGANPVAQFVGSFRWSISGGNLSLTNTTSFKSLTYDMGPQWQRRTFAPMGNTHQTYNISVTCR